MLNWPEFVYQWEVDAKRLLSAIQTGDMTPAEVSVMNQGLRIETARINESEVRLRLEACGLADEGDYVSFLAEVGAIHLLAMGADDATLLPAQDLKLLNVAQPSIYQALKTGSASIDLGKYLRASFVDEDLILLPKELVDSAVAISSRAGSMVFVAANIGDGNNYIRISLKGNTVKYSSFEEMMLHERDRMLAALSEGVDERAGL